MTTTTKPTNPENINWRTPSRHQGQIVEVSYGLEGRRCWRRTLDHSDGETVYARISRNSREARLGLG